MGTAPFCPVTVSRLLMNLLEILQHTHRSGPSLSLPPPAACDVMEDVAIAYGYNNLVKTVPSTVTAGKELPLNQVVHTGRGGGGITVCGAKGQAGAGSSQGEGRPFSGVWCSPSLPPPLLRSETVTHTNTHTHTYACRRCPLQRLP